MSGALQKVVADVPAAITPMDLIARAQESNASIDQMQQLFELQLRYEDNEAKKAYYRAVSAFKAEAVVVSKDGAVGYTNKDGSFTGYKHATLGNIIATLTPILSKHGLSLAWEIDQSDGSFIKVTCHMTHEMGYSTQVSMAAGRDASGKKNPIQQIASTVSYLERYTALAITGTATAEQDDDAVASQDKGTTGFMATERFNEAFPAWEKIVEDGKKTPQEIIEFITNKGTVLSPGQIKIIESIGEVTDAVA